MRSGCITKFQDNLFPIQGEIQFVDMTTEKKAAVLMAYQCPFPRITKFATPSLFAGKWPNERGRLAWTNIAPSSKDVVRSHVRGEIRTRNRPGVEVTRGSYADIHDVLEGSSAYQAHFNLSLDVDAAKAGGSYLEFAIRPDMVGDDFTKLPNFSEELLKALIKDVAVEFLITNYGGLHWPSRATQTPWH